MKQQIHRLQLEKDALETATKLIKKAQGINLQMISNSEKAVVIDALRGNYCLKELLQLFNISKSSYFYQHHANQKTDKYKDIRLMIHNSFEESGKTYEYRRIHASMKRKKSWAGFLVQENVRTLSDLSLNFAYTYAFQLCE